VTVSIVSLSDSPALSAGTVLAVKHPLPARQRLLLADIFFISKLFITQLPIIKNRPAAPAIDRQNPWATLLHVASFVIVQPL